MKDSRGDNAVLNDEKEYPCLKCFSTVNAPLEHVCAYLSDKRYYLEYNDLLVDERELEDISTNSKICWAQSPQILFIKSRDFVTYCQYRWKRDGTQVLVNQAWEHDDALGVQEEVEGKICRATALRGANFISRDPNDPNKTRFALLAHANPGGGIPQWVSFFDIFRFLYSFIQYTIFLSYLMGTFYHFGLGNENCGKRTSTNRTVQIIL